MYEKGSTDAILFKGARLLQRKETLLSRDDFRQTFGADVVVCSIIANKKEEAISKVEYLLWVMYFLKKYPTVRTMCKDVAKCSQQKFYTVLWRILYAIGELGHIYIKFSNRYDKNKKKKICLATVDGTDFKIEEPKPFSTKWYSHKFKGAGLRYEVAIAIKNGFIVWINGPYPCGKWNDLSIFRDKLKYELDDDEKIEADKGYRGETCIRLPNEYATISEKVAKTNARQRHECINHCLKNFGVLKQTYRGDRKKHKYFFTAVAVIVQIGISCGFNNFDVSY